MSSKEKIYGIMSGQLVDIRTLQIGKLTVEDEFLDDKECGNLYEEVYEANLRLCERLGVDEDDDVETIVRNMFKITNILAMKMFDYGSESIKQEYVKA